MPEAGAPSPPRPRLVLWNIDLTLVDASRVSRETCAQAYFQATGAPLRALPLFAGQSDSEIFFEALALNDDARLAVPDVADELLARYTTALAGLMATAATGAALAAGGRALPGAAAALTALAGAPGVVQSVLTGSIWPSAQAKLAAFGLLGPLDTEIGGYGGDCYPRGALLLAVRGRAQRKYHAEFGPEATLYIADSSRDMTAARDGGAAGLAVATGRSAPAELRAAGAGFVLPDLADTAVLLAAVDRLVPPG